MIRLLLVVLLYSLWLEQPVVAQVLSVGAATIDITPPVGFRHASGYTEVVSTGVHDSLSAKAIVVRQGTEEFALVISDLLSVPAELVVKTREEAGRRTGIPSERIILAATHCHGSPEYWGSLRDIFHGTSSSTVMKGSRWRYKRFVLTARLRLSLFLTKCLWKSDWRSKPHRPFGTRS